jgi:predicted HAD superfamily Cof-like phosphohydrolase
MYKLVEKFNEEVIGIIDRPKALPDRDEHAWIIGVINEEKEELDDAYKNCDYIGYIDALIDNIYFCLGGLKRIGLNAEQVDHIFKAVHDCNMSKIRGRKTRNNELEDDAIKPENWVSPEEKIIAILGD